MAGVHWRSDGIQGILLGEKVALQILKDYRQTYNENFGGIFVHEIRRRKRDELIKDVVNVDAQARDCLRLDRLPASDNSHRLVLVIERLRVNLNSIFRRISQPNFGDARPRIKRQLDLSIIFDGRVRHFDNQQHIRSCRMASGIKIISCSKEGEVWLRRRELINVNRVLDADNHLLPDRPIQKSIETFDACRMSAPDGTHLDDLTFDQLHAIIFGQDAGLSHALIFVNIEPTLCELM